MKQIEEIAKSLGMSYKFGTYKEVNHLFDRSDTFPAVAELLPLKGSFELKFESVKDSQEITLLFLDIDGKTPNSAMTGEVVDRMKAKVLEFIKALNETDEFEYIDGVTLQYYTIVKQFDKCLSGVEITLNLKPNAAVCL